MLAIVRRLSLVSVFAVFSLFFNTLDAFCLDTLPKGVRAAAFVFGAAEGIRDGFNDSGRLESFTADVNRSITLNDLAAFEPQLKQLQVALNQLGPERLGDSLLVADIYANVDVNERRYVSALMWGVTNHLTIGAIVPLIRRDTRASFVVDTTNNAAKIKNIVGDVPKISEGLDQLANTKIDTATFTNKIFDENGYKVPTDFSTGGLGDIELEARYSYLKSSILDLQLRGGVKVPTAQHKADITNLLDRDLDDRFYSYRLGTFHSVHLIPSFLSLNSSVTGVYRRPYIMVTAVKKSSDQIIANLNDPEEVVPVRYAKGFEVNADTGVSMDFYNGALSLGANYVFAGNMQTKVSGPEGLYYEPLTRNSDSVSHTIQFSAELSSVPLFLAGKMPLPGKFALTWSQPFAGRNTLYTPYGRMDLIMLF